MKDITREEGQQLYQFFSSPNVDELVQIAKNDQLKELFKYEEFNVVKKLADNCSLEEFQTFLETKETPSIQLSPSEMEMIKGGGIIGFLSKIVKNAIRSVRGNIVTGEGCSLAMIYM